MSQKYSQIKLYKKSDPYVIINTSRRKMSAMDPYYSFPPKGNIIYTCRFKFFSKKRHWFYKFFISAGIE